MQHLQEYQPYLLAIMVLFVLCVCRQLAQLRLAVVQYNFDAFKEEL